MAKLHFYYGIMNCGKTTALLQTYYNYVDKAYSPLIFKPMTDNRDGHFCGMGKIQSRILKNDYPCFYFHELTPELIEKLLFNSEIKEQQHNVILVDEVQFLKENEIELLSQIVDKHNIPVICYGLKSDSNGRLFEGSSKLIALADDLKEIKQICDMCGKKATMNLRFKDGKIDKDGASIEIEKGNISYKSVCRSCWKKAQENID